MPLRTAVAVLALLPAAGLVAAAATPSSAAADTSPGVRNGTLYSGPGPRPGPDLLYQTPATAPQLTNSGIWHAAPILVSGASAYRDGEYLYQDYLYDDHGANGTVRDPGDPRVSGDTFSAPAGTYTYPTDPVYAGNAADLVELRVKPVTGGAAFRLTYDAMKDPSLVATTLAIGTSATPRTVPHGAGATAPAKVFVTVHGSTADAVDAATGKALAAPTVTVDRTRRQVEVRVPTADYAFSGPVRLAAASGLWDRAKGAYLLPQQAADSTHPGGAGTLTAPTAFFNVAFRHAEPTPDPSDLTTLAAPKWWRDSAQASALASGDLSAFADVVDFGKLARGVDDDMPGLPQGVPTTGPMDRILASHEETEQGADYSTTCGSASAATVCKGELRGRLQPYAVYVPPTPASGRYGLTLLLHSLGANYNQYLASNNQKQFATRSPGSIVITPSGRGPDGWYVDSAGADTFEVWADVAARYRLDPAYTAITGYSMGGYGTYRFATQYPDLFAKGQPTVGPPGLGVWAGPGTDATGGPGTLTYPLLASLRNIPFLIWVEKTDELVPYSGTQSQADGFDALGYRYEFDAYNQGDHLTLSLNDQFAPAAAWLGSTRVNRNPAHVTFVRNPEMDSPAHGMVADKAYWLSGVALRDSSGSAPMGTVDARSEGFGLGDPTAGPTVPGAGVLTGGDLMPLTYTSQKKTWSAPPAAPVADVLHVTATNVSAVSVDVARAHVDCSVRLEVTTDGPLTVTLPSCGRTETSG